MLRHDRLRVLGPIDLLTPDGVVPIGGRNLRAILGMLVISVGHAVPFDRLEDVVWGEQPPPSADGSLHSYVSRLRHVLGPETILSEEHSYMLLAESEQIDAMLFEKLIVRATDLRSEPEKCLALCAEGLALWRGTPFGELCNEDPFRLEVVRLDELRIATMELSLEAELALGRQELVIGELEAAVVEYPYRERLWYLLIEALHLDGRRVDAIRTCDRLRRELADVGISASNELCELERRILASDDASSRR